MLKTNVSINETGIIFAIEELGFVGMKILIALHKHKELSTRELIRAAGISSSSLYRAVLILHKYNLIRRRELYGRIIFCLTKKGERVASLIVQADKIMKENLAE